MNHQIKGGLYGCISAVSYAFNPLCAKYLYQEGVPTGAVLFYRFFFGAVLLALLLLCRRRSFRASGSDLRWLSLLGLVFALSSICFFESFHTLSMGLACTLVFAYPVIVALIMALFFKERLNKVGITSILLTMTGIALLYQSDGPAAVAPVGLAFVLGSALMYSLYIVVLNRSPLVMSSAKITFYVCLYCLLAIAIYTTTQGQPVGLLHGARQWFWAIMLGLVPTVISLVTMSMAVKEIGSTPTAIMGALEPVVAVVLGTIIFGEVITLRLSIGMLLILLAVILVITAGKLPKGGIKPYVIRLGRIMEKRWKWR